MSYLLIILILLVAAAPLVWVKTSTRQDKIAIFRQQARNKGIDVRLCDAPDARKGEGALDHVRYTLPWNNSEEQNSAPDLLLVRRSRRGDPAPWIDWRWLSRPANKDMAGSIGEILPTLSEDVTGLMVSRAGVGFFWQERASSEEFELNIDALENLLRLLKKSF